MLHADVVALREGGDPGARVSAEASADSCTGQALLEPGDRVSAETSADSCTGHAVLDPGVRVSAETSRRIACDAGVVRMTHAADGAVLDVGRRTRVVPAPIRRALDHRDRGCRFPGCRSRFCDAHHIVHWADGGATRLDNLALLCRFHHTAVHEHGYRVWIESAEVRFARPDGRPLEAAPPPPPLVGDPVDKMVSAHEAAGLTIGPDTATPQWSGERLDLGYALLTLLD